MKIDSTTNKVTRRAMLATVLAGGGYLAAKQLKILPASGEVQIVSRGNVNPKLVEEIKDEYQKLPDYIKKDVKDFGFTVVVTKQITDYKGSPMYNCTGLMQGFELTVAEEYVDSKTKKAHKNSEPRKTLRHEVGHAIDLRGYTRVFYSKYSDTEDFINAYNKDVGNISEDLKKDDYLSYFLQEGARGHEETFAEVFAELTGNDYVYLLYYFPNVRAYIQKNIIQETPFTTFLKTSPILPNSSVMVNGGCCLPGTHVKAVPYR